MPDTSAVTMKIVVLFFAMLCGVYARKRKFIDEKSTSALSAILVNVTNPLLIIYSFQKDFTPELLKSGLIVVVISVIIHLAATGIAWAAFLPVKGFVKRKTYRFATIFSNCGFLGYPVLMALFASIGDENGLFYGAFFTLFFNMYLWTYGVFLMNDGKGEPTSVVLKKVFLNPGIIATVIGIIIFLTPLSLPTVVFDSFKLVGDMTFPLSMVITGSLIVQMDFKGIFRDGALWFYCFVRLIALPLAALLVCMAIKLPSMYTYIAVTMSAMPGASITAIFADIYKKDVVVASKSVGVSTFVSIFTIPLILYIMSLVL